MGVPALAVAVMLLGAGARWGVVNADVLSAWRETGERRAVERATPASMPLAFTSDSADAPGLQHIERLIADEAAADTVYPEPEHASPALMPFIVPGSLVTMPEGRRFSLVRRVPLPIDGRGPALPMPAEDADDEVRDPPRRLNLTPDLWSLSGRSLTDLDQAWHAAF